MPRSSIHWRTAAGFVVADLRRLVVQRRLAEPLLEHAGRVEQVVGNDRVEHAHAAFVEHAHDRLVAAQLRRPAPRPSFALGGGDLHVRQRRDVVDRVLDACPSSASSASCLRKPASVKSSLHSVEYFTPALVSEPLRLSMPTRPGHVPRPVGDGEDRPVVRRSARAARDANTARPPRRRSAAPSGSMLAENLHALLLRADEAVLLLPPCTDGRGRPSSRRRRPRRRCPAPSRPARASSAGWPTGASRRWPSDRLAWRPAWVARLQQVWYRTPP